MDVLKIVEVTPEQIVIKVNVKDTLTCAKYPYLSMDMDYITITRGENHIFTIIKSDGKTWSFSFGASGYTLIGEDVKRLKNKVLEFVEEQGVLLEYIDGEPFSAVIYFNRNYNKWQLSIETTKGCFNQWSKIATNLETAIADFSEIVEAPEWEHAKAVTGIDIWKAKDPIYKIS